MLNKRCKNIVCFLFFYAIVCLFVLAVPFNAQAEVKTLDPDDPSLIFSDDFTGMSNESAQTIVAGKPIPIKSDGIEDVYSFFGQVTNNQTISYGYPMASAWNTSLTLSSTASAGGNQHIYNAVGLNKRYMTDKSTSYVTETVFTSKGGVYTQKKALIFPRFGLGNEWNHSYYFRIEMGTTNDTERKSMLSLYEVRGQTASNNVTVIKNIALSTLIENNQVLNAKTTLIDNPDGSVYVSLNLYYDDTAENIGFLEHTFLAESNPFSAVDAPYGPGFGMTNGNCQTNFRFFSVKDILSVKIKGQPLQGFKGSQYNYSYATSETISAADITAIGNIPETVQPEVSYDNQAGIATITYAGLTYTIVMVDKVDGVSLDSIAMTIDNQPTTTPAQGAFAATLNLSNSTQNTIDQTFAVAAVYNKNGALVACAVKKSDTPLLGHSTGNQITIEGQMPDIDYTDTKLKIFLWKDNLAPLVTWPEEDDDIEEIPDFFHSA